MWRLDAINIAWGMYYFYKYKNQFKNQKYNFASFF